MKATRNVELRCWNFDDITASVVDSMGAGVGLRAVGFDDQGGFESSKQTTAVTFSFDERAMIVSAGGKRLVPAVIAVLRQATKKEYVSLQRALTIAHLVGRFLVENPSSQQEIDLDLVRDLADRDADGAHWQIKPRRAVLCVTSGEALAAARDGGIAVVSTTPSNHTLAVAGNPYLVCASVAGFVGLLHEEMSDEFCAPFDHSFVRWTGTHIRSLKADSGIRQHSSFVLPVRFG